MSLNLKWVNLICLFLIFWFLKFFFFNIKWWYDRIIKGDEYVIIKKITKGRKRNGLCKCMFYLVDEVRLWLFLVVNWVEGIIN